MPIGKFENKTNDILALVDRLLIAMNAGRDMSAVELFALATYLRLMHCSDVADRIAIRAIESMKGKFHGNS